MIIMNACALKSRTGSMLQNKKQAGTTSLIRSFFRKSSEINPFARSSAPWLSEYLDDAY